MHLSAPQVVLWFFHFLNFPGFVLLVVTEGHGVVAVLAGVHQMGVLGFLPNVIDVEAVFILAVNNHLLLELAPNLGVLLLPELIDEVLHLSCIFVKHGFLGVKLI